MNRKKGIFGFSKRSKERQDQEDEEQKLDYRGTWNQLARSSSMYSIYATVDSDEFERGGQHDAERISQWVTPQSKVLDVGCGIGRVEKYLAPSCEELHVVDISEEMLRQAQIRLAEYDNIVYHHTPAMDLAFAEDMYFDFIFSLLVLQHVEKEDAFLSLREIHRVLKPGGQAYLQFPNLFADVYFDVFVKAAEMEERPAHRMRLYTPEEVHFILTKVGFEVEAWLSKDVEILLLVRKAAG